MSDASVTHLRAARVLLLAWMLAVGALLYNSLPEHIPTHWGFLGEADGWMPKAAGAWLVPGLALSMTFLLPFARRLDPAARGPRVTRPWVTVLLAMTAFFAYLYGLQLQSALSDAGPDVGRALLGGLGVLVALLGATFGSVERNGIMGIRTPWTLASDAVWHKTHRMAGRLWIAGGALILLEAIVWIGWPIVVFLALFCAMVALPIAYSLQASRAG